MTEILDDLNKLLVADDAFIAIFALQHFQLVVIYQEQSVEY